MNTSFSAGFLRAVPPLKHKTELMFEKMIAIRQKVCYNRTNIRL